MRVFAYCCKDWAESAREVTGHLPVTSPPTLANTFDIKIPAMEEADVLYFDLHGQEGAETWFNDEGNPALHVSSFQKADLSGVAVAILVNCHAGDEDSPMIGALLDSGVDWILAGEGPNYAPTQSANYGATLLAWRFLKSYNRLGNVRVAFSLAKRRVKADSKTASLPIIGNRRVVDADLDSLRFRLFTRRKE